MSGDKDDKKSASNTPLIQEVSSKDKDNWFKKKNSNYDQFDDAQGKKDESPEDIAKKIEELEKLKASLEKDVKSREDDQKQA